MFKQGLKILGEVSGKRYARESFVGVKCGSEILSSFWFKGTWYIDLFNIWIEIYYLTLFRQRSASRKYPPIYYDFRACSIRRII